MTSPFITPSNADGNIQVKQEPVDLDYQSTTPVTLTPQPPPSLPSPVQMPMLIKFRHDAPRSRTFDKPHNCCEVCQGEFTDQELLLQHKLIHFNTSHICYVCDCYFVNTSTLIMHIATNHRNLNPAMTGRNDPDRSFVCSICLQRFSSSKTLQRHQEVHKQQDERSFCCKICGLDFIGYRALVPHLNATRHKEMKIKIQSIFVCVDCRSVFPSRDSYAMHMMMRAQNETCSSHCGSEGTVSQPQKVYNYMMKNNGWVAPNGCSERVQVSPQSDIRLNDTLPLNLSVANSLTPAHVYKALTCVKCGETVPDEEALALHLMVHVREATEKPFYQRQNSFSRVPKAPSHEAPSSARTTETSKRSDSAPISDNAYKPHVQSHAVWTCHMCNKAFDTCDFLAMHMMEHHTLSKGEDQANNNDKASNQITNTSDTDSKFQSIVIDVEDTEKELVPITMPPDQISFSARSTPVIRKRYSESEDEDPSRPKRCRSLGSSIFFCTYCTKQSLSQEEKDTHIVNEHGVSLQAPHCLVCSIAFLQQDALKKHLETSSHKSMIGVQKTSCQMCDFVASSSAHFREHTRLHRNAGNVTGDVTQSNDFLPELLKVRLRQEIDQNVQKDVEQTDNNPTEKHTDTKQAVFEPKPSEPSALIQEMEKNNSPKKDVIGAAPEGQSDVNQTTVSSSSRRSKRKPRIAAKFIPGLTSPSLSENDNWMDETNMGSVRPLSVSPRHIQHPIMPMPVAMDSSNLNMIVSTTSAASMWPGLHSQRYKHRNYTDHHENLQRPSTTTGSVNAQPSNHEEASDVDLIDYVLSNSEKLSMCKYCKIIFTDQTMFYLHMGLHNLNDPWQCNLCGKVSRNVHEFTSHVIHY